MGLGSNPSSGRTDTRVAPGGDADDGVKARPKRPTCSWRGYAYEPELIDGGFPERRHSRGLWTRGVASRNNRSLLRQLVRLRAGSASWAAVLMRSGVQLQVQDVLRALAAV